MPHRQASDRATRERHFVERMGLIWVGLGAPPMMGRIVGRLLVCDPSYQSSGELAEYLQASKGAISTTTRMLIASGLITKVRVPGKRATFFQLQDGALLEVIRAKAAGMSTMRQLAAEGLEILGDASERERQRLQEFHDLYLFFEEAFPRMIDEWESRRTSSKQD